MLIIFMADYLDGLVQERRNSSANALEVRLFCTNPSISVLRSADKEIRYCNCNTSADKQNKLAETGRLLCFLTILKLPNNITSF